MAYALAFEEAGNEIFGCTAKELYLMKCEEQDYGQFADVVQGVLFNEYIFKLKVKFQTFYDGRHVLQRKHDWPPRVECTIVIAEKVNPSAECRHLLGAIDMPFQEGSGSSSRSSSSGFGGSSARNCPPIVDGLRQLVRRG